jgi:hypothetical protein
VISTFEDEGSEAVVVVKDDDDDTREFGSVEARLRRGET